MRTNPVPTDALISYAKIKIAFVQTSTKAHNTILVIWLSIKQLMDRGMFFASRAFCLLSSPLRSVV